MLKNILLIILCIVSGFYLWLRTPISVPYYLGQAEKLLEQKDYSAANTAFEHVLAIAPNNSEARRLYVKSLSQSGSGYSTQEKLYNIANSNIDDIAKSNAKALSIQLKHKLIEGVEDNYIYNAVLGKQIVHWDMAKFPIKVFYDVPPDIPPYYRQNIEKAFADWSSRTGFLKFSVVEDKKNSNIYITFKNYDSADCNDSSCHFLVAYTDPIITPSGMLERMNLTFFKTNPHGQSFTQREIYNTALHEIGHTLGLMGHSDNSSDVMFSNSDRVNDVFAPYRSELQYISMRDLKTLALLYRIKPSVSNTKNLQNEKFYYAPLILGNDEEILNKKLIEYERYIKDYPNFAAGYINISSVYSEMGDIEKALTALNYAQNCAKSENEKYLVEYNRAIIYFNYQDYKSALEFAQKAKSISDTKEINEIISEIEEIKK